MANFLFVYHGGKKPESPEESQKVMQQWKAWLEGLGGAVVDGGNPVGMSKTVYADRVADDGGANPVSGYSIISADTIEDAIAKGKDCPHVSHGGSIEIAEIYEIDL